jgi:hypothetical protein
MWPILLCLLLFLAKPAEGSEVPSECFELFRQARQQNIYFIPFIYHNKIVLSLTPGEKLSTIDLLAFSMSSLSIKLNSFLCQCFPPPLVNIRLHHSINKTLFH